jgi:NTP pyrophosphatase (non-canonical NTP hydrolase)
MVPPERVPKEVDFLFKVNMEIKELQKFIAEESNRINANYLVDYDSEKRILHAVAKLLEESGEVSDATLKSLNAQRKAKMGEFDVKKVGEEIADVYFTSGIIAHLLKIDIEEALRAKMKKIEARYDKGGVEKNV